LATGSALANSVYVRSRVTNARTNDWPALNRYRLPVELRINPPHNKNPKNGEQVTLEGLRMEDSSNNTGKPNARPPPSKPKKE